MGAVGTGELRDEAALAEVLRGLGREVEPLLVARNPDLVSVIHGVAAVPDTARSMVDSVRWCDAVVVMETPGAARVANRIGGLTAVAQALSRREVVRVRVDDRSLLSGLPAASAEEAANLLRGAGADAGKPVLVVSPKAMADEWQTLEQVRILGVAASAWLRGGGSVVGLALSPNAGDGSHRIHRTRRDAVLLAEVARAAKHPVPVVGPLVHPALLKAVVALAGVVVTARPETIELAGGAGVPCLGFGWERSVRERLAEWDMSALPERPSADDVCGWMAGPGVPAAEQGVTGGGPRRHR